MWLAEGNDARITDAQGRWTLDNVPAGDDVEVQLKLGHRDYISDFSWGVMQKLEKVSTASLRRQTATVVMVARHSSNRLRYRSAGEAGRWGGRCLG